jgi:hypothetical protein
MEHPHTLTNVRLSVSPSSSALRTAHTTCFHAFALLFCDRFSVVLDNTGRLAGAARLRFFRAQGSGITGVTAVLHHMESVDGSNNPVASPVPGLAMALEGGGSGHFLQISKNWHTFSALHNAYWQDMITMLSVPADTKMTLQMTWHHGHALGSGGDGGEAFNQLPIHVVSHAVLPLILFA